MHAAPVVTQDVRIVVSLRVPLLCHVHTCTLFHSLVDTGLIDVIVLILYLHTLVQYL